MEISEVYDAIKAGDATTVETYLQGIEDVTNAKLKVIDSLLAYAAAQDQVEIVKLLVNYNGNPETYNQWLLKYAYANGSQALINYLTTAEE